MAMDHDDDRPIGRVLSRREAVALLGASGAALLAGCRPGSLGADTAGADVVAGGAPQCVVRPEQMEGPYYVDGRLERADIRADPGTGTPKEGAPLALALVVQQVDDAGRCTPLAGARVDLWQCDAAGVYSDVVDPSFDTRGQKYLRGHQLTDRAGTVRFTTIYPGWYRGRTVHLHFKVRTDPAASRGQEFTSQLYFDDALTDRVFARAPYAARGPRSTRNDQDGIYRRGGDQLVLDVREEGDGYAARFALGMRMG
jgi:protocatechuate 3,4-dioxygenase beta subunit